MAIELDYSRIGLHLVVYILVWLLIYAKNRKAIEKHTNLTLCLGVFFAFVSLMLNGLLFPEFKEIWLSAFSWPVFVNYIILAYTIKEREKDIVYDLLSFLEEKEKYYREVIVSQYTEPFEKHNAKRMITCLKYLESHLKGIAR